MKKLNLTLFSLSFFIILTFISYSSENVISGKAQIVDGDTIKINKKKIRLFGIDAPEREQVCKKKFVYFVIINFQKDYKCGKDSTTALSKKIKNKLVKCIIKNNKDRYGRFIAICYVKNLDVNGWLVKNGYAIAYERYSKKYIPEQEYAKKNKLGLWKGTFIKPEKWRRIMN